MMRQAYGSSTFCLNPHGDTASRKVSATARQLGSGAPACVEADLGCRPRQAIFDALLMGCIPVLFHPAQKALYGWYHFDQLVVYFDFRRVLQGEDVFRFLDTVDVRIALSLSLASTPLSITSSADTGEHPPVGPPAAVQPARPHAPAPARRFRRGHAALLAHGAPSSVAVRGRDGLGRPVAAEPDEGAARRLVLYNYRKAHELSIFCR
eukprot:scaffold4470_cov255-Prasinococcus_capsulatus_cf.AAC.30